MEVEFWPGCAQAPMRRRAVPRTPLSALLRSAAQRGCYVWFAACLLRWVPVSLVDRSPWLTGIAGEARARDSA